MSFNFLWCRWVAGLLVPSFGVAAVLHFRCQRRNRLSGQQLYSELGRSGEHSFLCVFKVLSTVYSCAWLYCEWQGTTGL